MTPKKLVGRCIPLAVLSDRNPHGQGTWTERETTMNGLTNTHHQTRRVRGVLAVACLALLLSLTTPGPMDASPAYAGNWMVVSCENPTLTAAPSEGWSSFTTGGPSFGSNNSTNCGPGNPMSAILSSQGDVLVGSGENLQYTPPSGSTLVGGQVDAAMYGDGYGQDASGIAIAYSPEFAYNGSNVILQCAVGQPPCANGTNDFAGVLGLPSNRGGNFYIGAGCGGAPGQACAEGGSNGAWSLVQVWWANFLLSNTATPAAGTIGGTLLSPNARGTQELAFTATDPGGPGVYTTTAQIDGKTIYTGTPDTNGGKCVPVGSSGGALMFDYSQPCRQSESVDLPIDTTGVADGQHTLKLIVEDAAQNSSVVEDSTITTQNAPVNTTAPTILTPSQVFTGAALSTHPGAWSAPTGAGSIAYGYQWQDCDAQGNNCTAIAGAQTASYTPTPSDVGHTLRVVVTATDNDGLASAASAVTGVVLSAQGSLGAPNGPGTSNPPVTSTPAGAGGSTISPGAANGTVASQGAVLRLGVPHAITRPFAHRSFHLTGRLLDSDAQPIAGASLDVLQQLVGSSTTRIIGHVKTRTDGTFTMSVPAGPSRLIQVAYKAFSGDTAYTAEAKVQESVGAGVKLSISPHSTAPTGTIVLSGQVIGPVPSQGVVVELLVHYLGHWEPFRDPRTDSNGRFQVVYQFQGGTGRFPFRAEVPTGQANFPFIDGQSKAVDVATN
jgi:hypothetical protein